MPRKIRRTEDPLPPPQLQWSRDEAEKRLTERITKGRELLDTVVRSDQEFAALRLERDKWRSYNRDMLARMFDNRSKADEYSEFIGGVAVPGDLPFNVDSFKEEIATENGRLESIHSILEIIEPIGAADSVAGADVQSMSRKVFIVHGHEDGVKETVARFVSSLGLDPIILHEQPNTGKTLIEKFEANADVCFAVVLMTPDDIGHAKDRPDKAAARPRQNVVLELGYFVGRLGRPNVCALVTEGLELPSDILGLAYVAIDDEGAWRGKLAKELKAAGVPIDAEGLLKAL